MATTINQSFQQLKANLEITGLQQQTATEIMYKYQPGCRNKPLSDAYKETNRRKLRVRAKVEHPFRPFKNLYGFAKTRYRGPLKNANRAFALLALINLEKWGRPLTGSVRPA